MECNFKGCLVKENTSGRGWYITGIVDNKTHYLCTDGEFRIFVSGKESLHYYKEYNAALTMLSGKLQDTAITTTTNKENKEMGIEIKEQTLVNGVDVATMKDEQLFDLIANAEKAIDKLDAIKNKPKKLMAKIEAINGEIKSLVKIIDSRK